MTNSSNTIPQLDAIRVMFRHPVSEAPEVKGQAFYFTPVHAEWVLTPWATTVIVSGPSSHAFGKVGERSYILGQTQNTVPDWLPVPREAIAKAEALIADLEQAS